MSVSWQVRDHCSIDARRLSHVDAGLLEWKGWFGGDGGAKGAVIDQVEDVSRAEELRQVQILRERVVREALEEEDPPPKSLFGFT